MKIICFKCKEKMLKKILSESEKVILILESIDETVPYSNETLEKLYKIYRINSIDSIEELVAVYQDILNEKDSYDKVFAGEEHAVLAVGFFYSLLKKDFKYLELAIGTRDKRAMKEHFKNANLDFAKFKSSYSLEELKVGIGHGLTYPIVAKPACGMGSYNTEVLYNSKQLEKYFLNLNLNQVLHSDQIVLEEYIDGKEYHADMLWKNGECIFLSIFQDLVPRIEVMKKVNRNGSFLVRKELNPILYQEIEKKHISLINELKYFDGIMHTEFFVKDGKIYFSEIAKRNGGGAIVQAINVAFGIDLIEEWLNIELGKKLNLNIKHPSKIYCRLNFSPLKAEGIIKYVPTKEDYLSFPWIKHVEIFIKEGQKYSHSTAYIKSIYLVIEAEDEEDLIKKIDEVYEKYPIVI